MAGESLPRSKLAPDGQSLVSGSDRIAAQAMAPFPPPCFSHKTLRGLFLLWSDGVMERGSRKIYELFPIESRRNDSVFLAS